MTNPPKVYRDGDEHWRVWWYEGGKRKTKRFSDRQEADTFAQQLHGGASQVAQPVQPVALPTAIADYDQSADWWDTLLGTFARQVALATLAGDGQLAHELRASLRAISQAATAQQGHRDLKKTEKLIRDLQARYTELTQAATSGATGSWSARGTPAKPV